MNYKKRLRADWHKDRIRIGVEWMLPLDEEFGGWFSFDILMWSIYLDWEPRP